MRQAAAKQCIPGLFAGASLLLCGLPQGRPTFFFVGVVKTGSSHTLSPILLLSLPLASGRLIPSPCSSHIDSCGGVWDPTKKSKHIN
jgi:hypothetical protein